MKVDTCFNTFSHSTSAYVCVCLCSSQSHNVVVVQQPAPTVITTSVRPTGDHYMTLSIVMTILCAFCFSWYALLCTLPAIIFATNVSTESELQPVQHKLLLYGVTEHNTQVN